MPIEPGPEALNGSTTNTRELKRAATRARILESAVDCVINLGVRRTTTIEVQHRAGVSRGALLHYFPTHARLMSAMVEEVVRRNEQVVTKVHHRLQSSFDPLACAIHALVESLREPTFMAELELWVVARTDDHMRSHLIAAERKALRDRDRVLDQLFGSIRDYPAYDVIVNMSWEFARGLAVSGLLRRSSKSSVRLVEQWIWSMRQLLELEPPNARSERTDT